MGCDSRTALRPPAMVGRLVPEEGRMFRVRLCGTDGGRNSALPPTPPLREGLAASYSPWLVFI